MELLTGLNRRMTASSLRTLRTSISFSADNYSFESSFWLATGPGDTEHLTLAHHVILRPELPATSTLTHNGEHVQKRSSSNGKGIQEIEFEEVGKI